ncbi:hypothetical protein IWX90DRAFT_249915 [Phyllosticta citrichinensis]|uniref:Zn(2)-C6 fungal-type domain-containing protein n=1 Tax=Phyllosticta citrichinensis TaxID=1130410 RepID=A0ABR1XRI9_9PEZI
MALQTCKRCRKRRIKCDLQLPACTSCQLVDLECLYYDDSLGHDVPRSYLHALSKKVESLEYTINAIKGPAEVAPSPSPFPHADCQTPWQTSQDAGSLPALGLGTSAGLLENLLRALVQRQSTQDQTVSGLSRFAAKAREVEDDTSLAFPPLKINFSKLDTQSLQQPHLQRALIEYYAKVVQSSFALLSSTQINNLLRYEHPLRQCTASERLPVYGIFAISSTLVARDLDSDQSITASMWTDRFQSYIAGHDSSHTPGEARMKQTIFALCFLALLDLVSPVSSKGSVWEVVGAASRSYVKLLDDLSVSSPEMDEEFERLGHCIYLLESTLSIHFRLPSLYCNSAPTVIPNGLSEPLVYHTLYTLTQELNFPQESASVDVESRLIPVCLQIDTESGWENMSLGQAQVYLTLHPLFTSPGAGTHCCSQSLLLKIAMAAAAFIMHTHKLNRERRVISIWVSAENVMQAGAAWAAYLMLRSQRDSPLHDHHIPNLVGLPAIEPIVKCSSILSSFAERWKCGRRYCQAWDAFADLLLADENLSKMAAGLQAPNHPG